jgi:hypothetical protein
MKSIFGCLSAFAELAASLRGLAHTINTANAALTERLSAESEGLVLEHAADTALEPVPPGKGKNRTR